MSETSEPAIENVDIWVRCPCGSEVEFDAVGSGTTESIECDDCGRLLEVQATYEVRAYLADGSSDE